MIWAGGSSISSSLGSVLTICLLTSSLISGWYWCFNNSKNHRKHLYQRQIWLIWYESYHMMPMIWEKNKYLSRLPFVLHWYRLHIFRQRPKKTDAIKLEVFSSQFGILRNEKPTRPIHETAKNRTVKSVTNIFVVKIRHQYGAKNFLRTRAYFFSIRTRRKSELTPL